MLWEENLAEVIIMSCQLNTDKVSVSYLTRLRQGHNGNLTEKGNLYVFGQDIFIIPIIFSL
jgi:hypothetical protein